MTRTRVPRKVIKREAEAEDQDGSANGDGVTGDSSSRRSTVRRTGRSTGRTTYREDSASDDEDSFEDMKPRKKNARKSKLLEPQRSEDEDQDKVKEEDYVEGGVRNRYSKGTREASDSESDDDEGHKQDSKGNATLSEKVKETEEMDVETDTESLESNPDGEPPPSKKIKTIQKSRTNYEVQEILDMRWRRKKRVFKVRWLGLDKKSDSWEKEEDLDCSALLSAFLQNLEMKVKKEEESGEFEVERILEVHFKKNGERDFLVRWKGYMGEDDTWVPEKDLNCEALIEKFMDKVTKMRDETTTTRKLRSNRPKTDRLANSIIWPTHFGDSSLRHSRRLKSRPRVIYQEEEYFDMD